MKGEGIGGAGGSAARGDSPGVARSIDHVHEVMR